MLLHSPSDDREVLESSVELMDEEQNNDSETQVPDRELTDVLQVDDIHTNPSEQQSSDEEMHEASEPESDPYDDPCTPLPAYHSRESSLALDDDIVMHAVESGAESEVSAADVDMENVAMAKAVASDIEMMSEVEVLEEGNQDATDLQPFEAIQQATIQSAMEEMADGKQEIGETLSIDNDQMMEMVSPADDKESVYESDPDRDVDYDYDTDELEELNEELQLTFREIEEYMQA
ncbi:hypothetical protein COEREDRAFT_84739 [Coemansia reversa NRRL 1564]|uniref:Uncharacterized protein n=1 Tax=Coemansia reversa (strain ATCC 12441 / NRRL 1564) TaxID=763665 RepID=A0A2G5BIG5_COERN|nr:hypothetical protein COEREDRAFT_84739 [Coemansia reversa NRRL 1564]|eukprot:PIA18783.1 hypothetical protein COEREDRAFT_84739 [Coemansia reversa NRRL 1564]